MQSNIQRQIRLLHRLEDFLLSAVLASMLILAMTDIALRLATGGSPIWIPPVLKIMVLWLGLLGALLASRDQEHIAINVVSRFVGALGKKICGICGNLFAAIICAIVAYFGVELIQTSLEYNDIAFAQVPAWPLQIIIPFSFGLMALRFLLHTFGYIKEDNYPPSQELEGEAG